MRSTLPPSPGATSKYPTTNKNNTEIGNQRFLAFTKSKALDKPGYLFECIALKFFFVISFRIIGIPNVLTIGRLFRLNAGTSSQLAILFLRSLVLDSLLSRPLNLVHPRISRELASSTPYDPTTLPPINTYMNSNTRDPYPHQTFERSNHPFYPFTTIRIRCSYR